MWRVLGVLTILVAQVAAAALAQRKSLDELQLSIAVDRQAMTRAEQLRLTLSVEVPPDIYVSFQPIDEALGPFQVIERYPRGPLVTAAQAHRWQREYLLRPDGAGELTIPSLTITFFKLDQPISRTPCLTADVCPRLSAHDPGPEITFADTRRELSTDPIVIAVAEAAASEPVASNANEDSKTAAAVVPRWPAAAWIGGSLAALAAFALLVITARRQQVRPESIANIAATDSELPREQVLKALAQLRGENLIEKGQIDEVYQRLTALLRQSLAARLGLPVHARTSEELLAAVQAGDAALAAQHAVLAELLRHCDLVKFARHQPPASEVQWAYDRVQTLVEQSAV